MVCAAFPTNSFSAYAHMFLVAGGTEPAAATSVLGVFVFAGAVANLVSGTVVKKLGTTRTAAVMFGGFALGIACLVAGAVTGQHALLPAGVVLCAAIGPSGILPGLLIPQLFGRRDYASISAVGMGMFYLGAACSFFILSLIHIFPVATGWQVAVPLIGMMALLMAYAPDYISMENDATRRRSFLLLGIVATTYAVASGMFDGLIGEAQRAAFNPMVLIEGGGALVIALVCLGMRRLEPAKAARLKGAGTLLLVLPTFALGLSLIHISPTRETRPPCREGVQWSPRAGAADRRLETPRRQKRARRRPPRRCWRCWPSTRRAGSASRSS